MKLYAICKLVFLNCSVASQSTCLPSARQAGRQAASKAARQPAASQPANYPTMKRKKYAILGNFNEKNNRPWSGIMMFFLNRIYKIRC